MAKNKTTETAQDPFDFILEFTDSEQKKQDSYALIELMQELTGSEPKMWGATMIGFGSYHYRYPSGHEGEAPLLAFSPRKAAISIYAYTGLEEHEYLLTHLGKFTRGKACLYVKKLADIDMEQLTTLCRASIQFLQERYT